MNIKDIDNPQIEFENLTKRFKLLSDRFLAIAMDYKHYIDSSMADDEIYKLRDNIQYRFYSARFHFQLLLEHHSQIEHRLKNLFTKDSKVFFQGGFELMTIQDQSTKEIYSLFDSMIYHLCSIFDYLFRLINYTYGKTILKNPKWNIFQNDKNLKNYLYCSKEIIPRLQEFDSIFVYPLIKHRSHLIHTANDTGEFRLTFNLGGDNFNSKFQATELFIKNFPEINKNNENCEFTIKYASFWLIDKTLKITTEILFELRDDMVRNKKIPHGNFVILGQNNSIEPMSTLMWGNRNNS